MMLVRSWKHREIPGGFNLLVEYFLCCPMVEQQCYECSSIKVKYELACLHGLALGTVLELKYAVLSPCGIESISVFITCDVSGNGIFLSFVGCLHLYSRLCKP